MFAGEDKEGAKSTRGIELGGNGNYAWKLMLGALTLGVEEGITPRMEGGCVADRVVWLEEESEEEYLGGCWGCWGTRGGKLPLEVRGWRREEWHWHRCSGTGSTRAGGCCDGLVLAGRYS